MTTHDKDKIIAIAEEVKANNDMFGDFSVALYAIAFEDGAASRDAEVIELRKRLTTYNQRIVDIGVLALNSVPKTSYEKMVQIQAAIIVRLQKELKDKQNGKE